MHLFSNTFENKGIKYMFQSIFALLKIAIKSATFTEEINPLSYEHMGLRAAANSFVKIQKNSHECCPGLGHPCQNV
jgi:hypothetical protein